MTMKQYQSLEKLGNHPVFREFLDICKVPRPSYREEKISNYLYDWAAGRGLEVVKDKFKNILIRKEASQGYENVPGIILQAHMDMVCEKAAEVEHDFDTDAIIPVIEGDLLTTGGRTTLGADNGIGVAMALAVLSDEELPHPMIEALFTTAEEEDLSGAQNFDSSSLKGKFLLNLDHAADKEFLCGSCQGTGVKITYPASYESCEEDDIFYQISIHNMTGGHSGEDIHRGHGSANQLMGRMLYKAQAACNCRICALEGGSFRLAIPRDASMTVALSPKDRDAFEEALARTRREFFKEYEVTAPNMEIAWEEISDEKPARKLSTSCQKAFLYVNYLSADGINAMSGAIPGNVESSDNMGELHLDSELMTFVYEIRASFDSTRAYLEEKLKLMAEIVGGEIEFFSGYPGWEFQAKSRIRDLAVKVYRDMFKEDPVITSVHAGLECGCFFPGNPQLDAISIGPDAWDFHSPTERVSISSTEKVYELLKELIIRSKEV